MVVFQKHNNTFVDIGNDGLRIELAGLDGGSAGAGASSSGAASNASVASPSDVEADPRLDTDHGLGAPSDDGGCALPSKPCLVWTALAAARSIAA